jgi:hypothetical protein
VTRTAPLRRHGGRRLAATAAVVVLPLTALVGCGEVADAKRASVESDLQSASDHLMGSGSLQVAFRFADPQGTAKKAIVADSSEGDPAALADSVLGGTVRFTLDPTGDTTIGQLKDLDPAAPPAEQLKRVNVALSVESKGGAVAQLRLVDGDLYVAVSRERIEELGAQGGADDVGTSIDEALTEAPPEYQPLIQDLSDGKWVKVPLTQYVDRLAELGDSSATPAPQVDGDKVAADLLAAVKPFTEVIDAGGDDGKRVLDVRVQAKQALKAALDALKKSAPQVPGLADLDTTALDELKDGTANGQVVLEDEHLTEVSVDLPSLIALAPEPPTQDLAGTRLVLAVDDSADEVSVPDDVSDVDVAALVDQLLEELGPLFGDSAAGA